MERRSSLRRPIHHDAMLRLEGGATRTCIIADFCSEGMFIKYSQTTSIALEADMRSSGEKTFTIVFSGHQKQQFEIVVEPVNLIKGAAGVRFVGRYNEAVQSLLALGSAEANKAPRKEELDHIIHESIDCIQNFTRPLMSDFYPVLITEIKESAIQASTDQLANATMAAAGVLEKEQQQQQQRFQDAIKDPAGLSSRGNSDGPEMIGRLAMIDKGEFEDWLTIRVLVTKAETNYRALLLPLKMRLDAIGLADKKHHQSPFGPSLLVSAFQSSLGRMRVDSPVEKLIFRSFEKQVMSQLEPMYEALNAILIRHNILPELDLSKQVNKAPDATAKADQPKTEEPQSAQAADTPTETHQPEPEERPRFSYGGSSMQAPPSAEQHSVTASMPPFQATDISPSDAPSADDNNDSSTAYGVDHGVDGPSYQNVVGLVRSLRGDQNTPAVEAPASGESNNSHPRENYSEAELVESLSAMQLSSITADGSQVNRSSLLGRVQGDLQQEGANDKDIHEDQQVSIDVVDRFFESLSRNPRLTHEAKQHLYKLEIPVLKVLLKDESFFDDRNSSVRAVMNRIAQLGAKGSRLSPSGQKRIEALVRKIVEEFDHDTVIFDQVLNELNELVDRQNRLYVKNVERVAAAAEGAHQVEQAKIGVAQALNERLGNRSIPKAVVTLLDNGWQDLLNLIHIKHGKNSQQWQRHMDVIDTLIAYSDDPNNHPLNMQELLPRIQQGLKEISGSSDSASIIRDELKSLIKATPEGAQALIEAPLREVPENEDDVARRNVRKSQALKHWIVRAKSIQVGSWIQFNRKGEETQYMRLVWIAKGYSKFVFVNHQGMKVVELGLFKFANHLKDKVVVPDPNYEVPIVNQGLDDMVKDVYDKLAYESCHDKSSGLANKAEFCRQVRALMKSGEKSSPCSLLYVHFDSMSGDADIRIPAEFAKQVADSLKSVSVDQSVIGRISETDFVLFSVNDELDMTNISCGERLLALCQQQSDIEKRLIVALGESRAHLGFNNPESMISHALRPIMDRETKLPDKDNQISAERVEPVPESTNDAVAAAIDVNPTQTAPETDSALVQIDESVNAESAVDTLAELNFEIYCQKSMSLASDSVHEEQYELVCSIPGSGVSFEPDSEEIARALDQWWIDQLLLKNKNQNPAWDSIDFMRVKLSAYAFQDDTFKDYLVLLSESGALDAGRIWFDIYDCSVIDNIHAAADMIKHLMTKGFRFSLDHFGTSRAPYALLKVLPVDMIIIDDSFIDLMNQDEADETATDSIIEVAHYLSKEVLATSVDSAICLQRMKQLGVDYVQGATISEYELLESCG